MLLLVPLAALAALAVMLYFPHQPIATNNVPPEVPPGEGTLRTDATSKVAPVAITEVESNENLSDREVAAHRSSTVSISESETATDDQFERIVKEKFEQLQELATKSDPASMEAILAEMKSPYAEVRADALEAIIQFRSRDAIPALKELATQTEDSKEKTAILEAVEFLQLPTLDEFLTELDKGNSQNPRDVK
jgi:hypothetical protein